MPDVTDFSIYLDGPRGQVLDGGCGFTVDSVRSARCVLQCSADGECESLGSIGFCLPPMDSSMSDAVCETSQNDNEEAQC